MNNLDNYQFIILSAVVAMAAYIGTVAREIFRKLYKEFQVTGKCNWERVLNLAALGIGDTLLVVIAVSTGVRISRWIRNIPIQPKFDRYLVVLIFITISYMAVLHALQWVNWLRKILWPEQSERIYHQVVWVDIRVIDLERAAKFYSAILGAAARKEEHSKAAIGFFTDKGSEIFGCFAKSNDEISPQSGPLLYLNTNGRIDEALAAVEENGGKIIEGKRSIGSCGFRAIIKDSEGNQLALHSNTISM